MGYNLKHLQTSTHINKQTNMAAYDSGPSLSYLYCMHFFF